MEIKKLEDVIAWADNQIEEMRMDFPYVPEETFKTFEAVTGFEAIKKVVNEANDKIIRHKTYTNALNKDIADKAAKIDLLEKEIEGRKEGYAALKARMDTKYISIDDHDKIVDQFKEEIGALKKEIKSITKSRDIWFDTAGGHSDTIIEQSNTIKKLEEKVKHQKENLDGINKTLEIRTKENERLIAVKNNQDKEIEAHESENARLSEKIIELKRTIEKCKDYDASLIDSLRINNDDLKEQVEYLKKELKKAHDRIDAENRVYKMLYAEYEKLEKLKGDNEEDDHGKSGFKRYIEHLIEEEERAVPERFKERLNEEITAIFTKEEETEVNDIPFRENDFERYFEECLE